MRQAQIEWRMAFDSVRDPMFFHDAEFRIVRANLAYAALAGRPIQELIGKPYWQVFPVRDGPLPGCTGRGGDGWREEEFSVATGQAYSSRSFSVMSGSGEYLYSFHVLQDVTERNRVRDALASSERRFRGLIENSADAFLVIDGDGKLAYFSESGRAISGYEASEVMGRDVTQLIVEEDRAAARAMFGELAREPGASKVLTLRARRRDGAVRDLELVVKNSLHLPEIAGLVVTVRDITERKRAEAVARSYMLRLSAQATALADTVASPSLAAGEVEAFARELTERAARTAGCERANVWLFSGDESELRCIDLYEATPAKHSAGLVLKEAEFRNEFEALKRAPYVDADDPFTDPRTAGYVEGYVKPLGITSMLDVVVAFSGRHLGLLCLEHVGKAHHWEDDEIAFACQLADKLALAIVNRDRLGALRRAGALLAHASDLMVVVDAQGIVQYISPSIRQMGGYEPEEVLGRPFTALMHPEDARVAAGNFAALISEPGTTHAAEFRYRAKDGRWLTLASIAANALDDPAVTGIVLNVRDITERKLAEETLRRTNRALRTLSAGNEALVRATDEAGLLREMARILTEIGGYRIALVCHALDDEAKSLAIAACEGFGPAELEAARCASWADSPRGQSAVGRAVCMGSTQVVLNPEFDPESTPWRREFRAKDIRATLGIPLRFAAAERPFGALGIATAEPKGFGEDELELLEELSGDIAYGIANLRLQAEQRTAGEKLRRSLESTIGAISATMETRDPYTAGHQRRVADLAAAIAREMGLAEDAVQGIHFGALIHDLGKIQVPAEILSKPTRLSKLELELIKVHAQAGYDIIKGVDFPWPVAQMVLQHHERIDGSGYPQGLTGEQMVPESRILAVADVVEAMSSHRPYRPGLGIDAALREIEEKRGKWFEPAAVDACLRLFREKAFTFDSSAKTS
jgi:PAS domain S-box-containing protein